MVTNSTLVGIIVSLIIAFVSSNGYWSYRIRKMEMRHEDEILALKKEDSTNRVSELILHRCLLKDCREYKEKGRIDQEQYDDLYEMYVEYAKIDDRSGVMKRRVEDLRDLVVTSGF